MKEVELMAKSEQYFTALADTLILASSIVILAAANALSNETAPLSLKFFILGVLPVALAVFFVGFSDLFRAMRGHELRGYGLKNKTVEEKEASLAERFGLGVIMLMVVAVIGVMAGLYAPLLSNLSLYVESFLLGLLISIGLVLGVPAWSRRTTVVK
jgi:hypothetical protein